MEKALSLFPEGFRLLGKKAFILMGATVLWGAACWCFAALVSYDSYDASWNTAIEGATHNWAQQMGAYYADFSLQGFGLASFFPPIVLFIWGLLVVRQRAFSFLPIRILSAVALVFSASLTLATLDRGGLWGHLALSELKTLFESVDVFPFNYAFIAFFLGTAVLFVFASGVRFKDFMTLVQMTSSLLRVMGRGVGAIFSKVYCLFRSFGSEQQEAFSKTRIEPMGGAVFAGFNSEERGAHDAEGADFALGESGVAQNKRSSYPVESPEDLEKKKRFWDRSEREEATQSVRQEPPQSRKENIIDLSQISHEYQLPSMDLLKRPVLDKKAAQAAEDLEESADQLSGVLDDYGVRGEITNVCPGPVVTLYQLTPAPGVKSSRVTGLADDIARSMCALSARVSTIPGQNAMGIELPNKVRQTVFLRELLSERRFEGAAFKLALALGKDIGGRSVIADLARMPHLLVAGTTGSGKSVAINTMILSLLYRLPPEKCRFLMIDPKMLELSIYNDIPHLLAPVVTDPKKAIVALKWAVREMEDRYKSMSRVGVRNIEGYNARLAEAKKRGEELTRQVHTGFDPETGKPVYETQHLNMDQLPYIVVIVDEMADLMMVAGKEIEAAVQRLAQMARAAGIHLIMATQRPSVDVITGTIKANFPTRISFQVTSKFDSRTILGEQGAEQLLGRGDMLFMEAGGKTQRVHGPFVSDEEVESVVSYLKEQGVPEYVEGVTDESADSPLGTFGSEDASEGDTLYQQAVDLVLREGKASTSFVQRHLQIGYNRAARLIEQMETEGIISAANHVGKREVLMKQPA